MTTASVRQISVRYVRLQPEVADRATATVVDLQATAILRAVEGNSPRFSARHCDEGQAGASLGLRQGKSRSGAEKGEFSGVKGAIACGSATPRRPDIREASGDGSALPSGRGD